MKNIVRVLTSLMMISHRLICIFCSRLYVENKRLMVQQSLEDSQNAAARGEDNTKPQFFVHRLTQEQLHSPRSQFENNDEAIGREVTELAEEISDNTDQSELSSVLSERMQTNLTEPYYRVYDDDGLPLEGGADVSWRNVPDSNDIQSYGESRTPDGFSGNFNYFHRREFVADNLNLISARLPELESGREFTERMPYSSIHHITPLIESSYAAHQNPPAAAEGHASGVLVEYTDPPFLHYEHRNGTQPESPNTDLFPLQVPNRQAQQFIDPNVLQIQSVNSTQLRYDDQLYDLIPSQILNPPEIRLPTILTTTESPTSPFVQSSPSNLNCDYLDDDMGMVTDPDTPSTSANNMNADSPSFLERNNVYPGTPPSALTNGPSRFPSPVPATFLDTVMENLINTFEAENVDLDDLFDGVADPNSVIDNFRIGDSNKRSPYIGSEPVGLGGEPGPGRPAVVIPEVVASTYDQEIKNILIQITLGQGDIFVYYMSEPALLPFIVVNGERVFADDECYLIILQEYYVGVYQWNVYYVMGENSDNPTRSEVAEYAVMLHNKLKRFNISHLNRKFEYFAGKDILVSTARNILSTREFSVMYMINETTAIEVSPKKEHLQSDNCVVLFKIGSTIDASMVVQACGSSASANVESRMKRVTDICTFNSSISLMHGQNLLDQHLDKNISNETDFNRTGPRVFLQFLETDQMESAIPMLMERALPMPMENTIPIPYDMSELNSSACYMLDSKTYTGVFFWIGKNAPITTQSKGIERMETYINEDIKLPDTSVFIMEQGKETGIFQIYFREWLEY